MDELNLNILGRDAALSADDPERGREEPGLAVIMMMLHGETFAIPLSQVKEIIRVPHITWVPGAPATVKGIINLRGTVVAVLELAALLGHPAVACGQTSRIVIVDSAGAVAGLLVEEVLGVEEVAYAAIEPSMRTLDEQQRNYVSAQAEAAGRLVGVLDIDVVLENSRPAENF